MSKFLDKITKLREEENAKIPQAGYTPVRGIDYFTEEDIDMFKYDVTPIKGVDYFDGADGVDGDNGYTPIKGVDYFDGNDGEDGKDADETIIIQKILEQIPQLDTKKLKKEILSSIPNKSDLKIIQERIEFDPMSVINKILALPGDKFKLKTSNIDGLEQTISAFRNQISTRGYLHGGGISDITGLIQAGTNITITGLGTKTDPYIINASGGGTTLTIETNSVLNGSQTLLNLVQGTNMTITDDGLGNITFDASGSSSVGNIYDVQLSDGSGGFIGNDNLNFQGGYLTINGDSGYGQLQWLNSPLTGGYAGSGITGIDNEIIVGALAGDMTFWSSQAMNLSADTGSTNMLRINTDGSLQIPHYGSGTFTGTPTYALQVDASGNIIEGSISGGGSPGGSNTQVQFNDSSAFNGAAGLIYDKTNQYTTIQGIHHTTTYGPITNPSGSITGTIVYDMGAGVSYYPNGGYSSQIRIYTYKDTPLGRIYSASYIQSPLETDNGANDDTYYIQWTGWNVLPGDCDGFRVLDYNTYDGYNFDIGYDLPGTTLYDGGDGSLLPNIIWVNDGGDPTTTPTTLTADYYDRAGYILGQVGFGTTSPSATAKWHFLTDDSSMGGTLGSLLIEGSTGTTPVSGAGVRLMWIPASRAFRVGEVASTQWDTANIGFASFAVNYNTKASGSYASAFGSSIASGTASTSFGGSTASGSYSIAAGESSVASSDSTAAFGKGNTASGQYSFTAGRNNTSSGTTSATIGNFNTASNTSDIALGDNNTSSGGNSTAFGSSNVASGQLAIAGGSGNHAVGRASISFGRSSNSYSDDCISMGNTAVAGTSGSATTTGAIALGGSSIASGQSSLALGLSTTASGSGSVAIGQNSTSTGNNAVAIAQGTATGAASISIGVFTNAVATSSFVFGSGLNSGAKLTAYVPSSFLLGAGSATPIIALNTTGVSILGSMPTIALSIDGTTARSFGLERAMAANTAGNNLTIQGGGATSAGAITVLNATPTANGSGYKVGDYITITTGGTNGTATVLTVNGTGQVLTVGLVLEGAGYTTGTGKATSGGTGTGLTLNITTVSTSTDKVGGNLILVSGISTGTGTSQVLIQTPTPGTTAATDNALATRLTIDSTGINIAKVINSYNGIATVSNGVPAEYGTVDLATQAAAITATDLLAAGKVATGMYRVSIYLQITRAASTSSVLGGATGVVITYTDGDGNVAQTDTVALMTTAGAVAISSATNTTATNLTGSLVIYAKTGVAVQYAIGYTSVGVTAMQYAAHLKVEAL